ncbi:MAG: membrane protein [Phycisphaerae bacterium]|nr:MAG: membrane protein [Phycisphaerae bacterium]
MTAVDSSHLPALFQVADASSTRSQAIYMRLVNCDLALIVSGSMITSWAVSSESLRAVFAIAGGVMLLASLMLTMFILQSRPDKSWFGTRAIAESVKKLAWSYMTGAKDFPMSLSDADADKYFCSAMDSVLQQWQSLGGDLGGTQSCLDQITQQMRDVRATNLEERKTTYLSSRIQDQRKWYAQKAESNSASANWWIAAIGIAQLAGAAAAIALVRWPNLTFNFASVFASLAAAFMAWLQVKQHQEQAQSYGIAASELGLEEAQLRHVSTENQFGEFVENAEKAISREHTMWVSRRDLRIKQPDQT